MKTTTKNIYKIQFCFLMALGIPLALFGQKNWTLIKDHASIQVFARDISGSNLKELKTVAYFDTHIDGILTLLTDVAAQPNYQYACISSKKVGKTTPYEQCFYQELYMPWPFSNRDAVIKQTILPKSNTQVLFIESNCIADLLPLSSNFVRVPQMQSQWVIKKINNTQVLGEYTIKVDPGGSVPSWLVNLFIDKGPYESVINMRKLLQEPKYKNAYVSWLHK